MIRKRLVRLHLKDDHPSIEGVVRSFNTDPTGHYSVQLAKLVVGEDQTYTLEGGRVRVPRERVVFIQELS